VTNILKHRGYVARVEFDAEDRIFFGSVAGIEDGVGFHADNVDGLVAAFEEAVDDYLDACERIGKTPQKPFSGNVFLRVDPAIHAQIAIAAKLAGMSLSQFGMIALEKAAKQQLPG
jgi:predicted HicB family RNase H-like nuclease